MDENKISLTVGQISDLLSERKEINTRKLVQNMIANDYGFSRNAIEEMIRKTIGDKVDQKLSDVEFWREIFFVVISQMMKTRQASVMQIISDNLVKVIEKVVSEKVEEYFEKEILLDIQVNFKPKVKE